MQLEKRSGGEDSVEKDNCRERQEAKLMQVMDMPEIAQYQVPGQFYQVLQIPAPLVGCVNRRLAHHGGQFTKLGTSMLLNKRISYLTQTRHCWRTLKQYNDER